MTRTFPKEELYGLTSQFRRAADSIVLNIAEGSGCTSKKEFSQFLGYSIRSGFECIGCLDIALENKFINEEIIAMLDGLQKSLRK
ncbi:MAG: four helix bundle protein [Bacteroidetes bacterium]|nr:four helix bundle protein [Bacteroidota bacterium]MBU1421782.1 four helix bundle protein [Bacteroidota bacterium]MBU2470955.1 four helix bundle protein [Bacteroidota bacterium]MBU2636972.1 four helix bundle protein [Bacteroidota bacterium]